nr:hypothetical protein [Streptomyces lasiicapitis]
MIVTGGENVYSAEVENALAQHPAVAAGAVIGVPDDAYGERVHAIVILKPGTTATAGELREHCKTLIAGYKAPRTTEFVTELPLSPAGKILKHELRKPHWEDKPLRQLTPLASPGPRAPPDPPRPCTETHRPHPAVPQTAAPPGAAGYGGWDSNLKR